MVSAALFDPPRETCILTNGPNPSHSFSKPIFVPFFNLFVPDCFIDTGDPFGRDFIFSKCWKTEPDSAICSDARCAITPAATNGEQ